LLLGPQSQFFEPHFFLVCSPELYVFRGSMPIIFRYPIERFLVYGLRFPQFFFTRGTTPMDLFPFQYRSSQCVDPYRYFCHKFSFFSWFFRYNCVVVAFRFMPLFLLISPSHFTIDFKFFPIFFPPFPSGNTFPLLSVQAFPFF